MKYLGIHKLLWFIIVVAFTLFEGVLLLLAWVLYFIWNLKRPKGLWSSLHESSYEDRVNGYFYKDNSLLETIIRRYKYPWED